MDKNNNTQQQFSNDTSLPKPTGEGQGIDQQPSEKTYWESQEQHTPETPEQFYQYYERQMKSRSEGPNGQPSNDPAFNMKLKGNVMEKKGLQQSNQLSEYQPPIHQYSGNPQPMGQSGLRQPGEQQDYYDQSSQTVYGSSGIYPLPKRKKSRGRLAVLTTVLLLLLACAGTAYIYRDTVINLVALYTQSPANYYAYVEKQTVKDALTKTTPYLDFAKKDYAADITTDITLNRDTLNSLMQSTFGTSLSEMESSLGFPLEKAGLHVISGSNGTMGSYQLGLRLNQIEILTLELFTDMAKQELYLRAQELSSSYIRHSLASKEHEFNSNINRFDNMTPERNADLLKRYSEIIIDHLSQVEVEKNVELTVNSFFEDCSKITVTITDEDINNAAIAILKEARDDSYIHELLPSYNLTLEEFQKSVDTALEKLSNPMKNPSSDSMSMIVYVNKQGRIISREISTSKSQAAFGYSILSKGNKEEYNLFLKDTDGAKLLEGSGSQSKEEDGYHGSMNLKLNGGPSDKIREVFANITYQGVRTERIGSQLYHYGSYNLSSLDLMGIQVLVENSVENESQLNKVTFQLGASPLVTFDTKLQYLSDYQITPPSEDAVIFDSTEFDSYLSTIDMEAFLKTLSDKLGFDLYQLLPYLSELPMQ